MKGWVADPPFPNPTEPNRGAKVLYSTWAPLRPFALHSVDVGIQVDRFGNRTVAATDAMFYQISHLSEPGMPINLPYANGNFYVSRFLVTEPEQSKYTTELQSQPDDPTRHPETFLFLPSLRRSLRLGAPIPALNKSTSSEFSLRLSTPAASSATPRGDT